MNEQEIKKLGELIWGPSKECVDLNDLTHRYEMEALFLQLETTPNRIEGRKDLRAHLADQINRETL